MACTWVATNTASPRPCGFSRASLTLVLGPHLFHMQLNEIHYNTIHYITCFSCCERCMGGVGEEMGGIHSSLPW